MAAELRQTFAPPILAILYLIVGWGVYRLWPVEPVLPLVWRLALGGAALLAGSWLMYRTITVFQQSGTTHKLDGESTALVTSGPHRWSRNAMYIGLTLAVLGIALFVGTVPMLLVPAALLLTLNFAFVPWEERRLEAMFGDEYREYQKRVRRWL